MKLVDKKYQAIGPDIRYLTDEVVIAQAWKKTHKYMRSHNWYADTLALDISALGLEGNASTWAKSVGEADFKPYAMELVPAAKSEVWTVDHERGWTPKRNEVERATKPPIRPLAHLTVRDQTLASAVMLCVADAVETAQGDCGELRFDVAQKKQVYSYGNRLLCDWKSNFAWFRWGNSETYRKFYTDYQNFLKRPIDIGRSIARENSDNAQIFILSLDLEKFYDRIDRPRLISILKRLTAEFGQQDTNEEFWVAAKNVMSWEWDQDALIEQQRLNIELGNGLPQGLVASGFLANAYMSYFDKEMGSHVDSGITMSDGIMLHDYCRYVDDLRLVVSIENADIAFAQEQISKWVAHVLQRHVGDSLQLNNDKMKVTALSDLDNRGSLSSRLSFLQEEISGPADRDLLDSALGVLEGLLVTQSDESVEPRDRSPDVELLRLTRFDQDIRPDTLKRFAANRLESIMRNKRKLTAADELDDNGGDVRAENESELLAKKLVKAWMQDPSLGLVLRKALEIFPSPIIAGPVFEAISKRRRGGALNDDMYTAAMMDYLLADLFRCCIDFNGFFQRVDHPHNASPPAVFDLACAHAQVIAADDTAAKFLKRQALLLLAVMQRPILLENVDETIQHSLHSILINRLPTFARQRLALFEVAAQITGRYDSFAALVVDYLSQRSVEEKLQSLEELAKRGGEFWASVWKRLARNSDNQLLLADFKWAIPVIASDLRSQKQRLSKVMASHKNGFEHEAALIKLGLSLIDLSEKRAEALPSSPSEIDVSISPPGADWTRVWRPEVVLKCSASKKRWAASDPRFSLPSWVSNDKPDLAKIYRIGAILRSAVIGGDDFTGNRWKKGEVQSYKGLRTGWYKRRMGMMYSAEALVGEYATVSGWFSDLLMACLQWPGFEATHIQHRDVAAIEDLASLKAVLSARLKILDGFICKASDMPALVTKVKRPPGRRLDGFRIVSVQQILPRTKDFAPGDLTLSGAKVRAENRDHLSRLALLTHRTLLAKLAADREEVKVGADLIVFPEVAVHPDDQDILKRLADKTKAIVFAGLVFIDHGGKLVNLARWFIPDYRISGRQWTVRDQGKASMTAIEMKLGVSPHRPCQHIIEISGDSEGPFMLSGAVCYDATDLKLATDLKDKTDLFIVCAHNKDVGTFDTMASALNYHMYQHIVLVNKGEFGGSTIQAPYREPFDRLISHVHGQHQISISVADLDLAAFRRKHATYKKVKAQPAGLLR